MSEELKVELERLKMRNYILEKENEILMGSIRNLSNEKRELLSEINNLKETKKCCGYEKIKKIIRRK